MPRLPGLAVILFGCGEVIVDQPGQITIEVVIAGSGGGRVHAAEVGIDCKPTCSAEIINGTAVSLIAEPDAGSVLAGWSIETCTASRCIVTPAADLVVTVTFERRKHQVVVTKLGEGSITADKIGIDCGDACTASYDEGTELTLNATPLGAASFGGWSEDCAGLEPTCTLVIDDDKRATASFDLGLRTLSVSLAGTGAGTVAADLGSISCPPTCLDRFEAGTTVALTATPDARSTFAAWSLAECPGTDPCRVQLTGARAVTATFEEKRYTLDVRTTGPGAATLTSIPAGIDCGPTCSAAFPEGTVVQLTATWSAGSRFGRWSDACGGVNPTCRLTMTEDFVAAAELERIPLLTSGGAHNCALRPNGELRCWGYNASGQLGLGHTDSIGDSELPSTIGPVGTPSNVLQLCAGGQFSCTLLDTGQVRCWGYNFEGQLGLGHNRNIGDEASEVPVATNVPLGAAASEISCGAFHACARLNDSSLRCWGAGAWGQLGYNCSSNVGDGVAGNCATLNDEVLVGGSVARIAAGGGHTCALMDTGALRCWGRNDYGQLGYGHMDLLGDGPNEMPTDDIIIPDGIVDVRLGAYHTCVLSTAGEVFCWGRADRGQLGNGSTEALPSPPAVPARLGGAIVNGLAANEDHSCVVLAGGGFRCWGYSASGQIGYGTMEALGDDPTDMVTIDLPLTDVILSTPGGSHTCALLSNDDVHCWGRGTEGQLGYGNMDWIGSEAGSMAGSAGSVF